MYRTATPKLRMKRLELNLNYGMDKALLEIIKLLIYIFENEL